MVAKSAQVDAADILDVDLCLMDSTPPCRIGQGGQGLAEDVIMSSMNFQQKQVLCIYYVYLYTFFFKSWLLHVWICFEDLFML